MMEEAKTKKLVIQQYTDPMCAWCLGVEPGLRMLEWQLGDRLEQRYTMGMLCRDVRERIGDDEFAPMRFRQMMAGMSTHFRDVEARTGMPVRPRTDVEPELVTSYPSTLAYEAMKLEDPAQAARFLRRIREDFLGGMLPRNDLASYMGLAREFDVGMDAFRRHLEDGTAEAALEADQRLARAAGVTGFPTLVVKYDGSERRLGGYVDARTLCRIVRELTGGELDPAPAEADPEAMEAFAARYGRVAAEELRVTFALDDEGLSRAVDDLLATGRFEKLPVGASYYVQAAAAGEAA